MNAALIGHTGFVGGNLLRQGDFTATYRSTTIDQLRGRHFDQIWCAGVRAVKWWANKHPDEDWQGIAPLLEVLATVECDYFVLISTVDVFQDSAGKDETISPQRDGLHPYGRHRLAIEDFVGECFPRHTIVRLPGLFGQGLKKNAIYDFLHDNQTEKLHADARYQFYDLATVHADCAAAVVAGLPLIHFAVEPVSVAELAHRAFNLDFANRPAIPVARYDLRTVHAGLHGRSGPYLQDREEVLDRLTAFVRQERGRAD